MAVHSYWVLESPWSIDHLNKLVADLAHNFRLLEEQTGFTSQLIYDVMEFGPRVVIVEHQHVDRKPAAFTI